ncbi:hypothetical protein BY996DRAFT_6408893 [Phakopsora pachyrhizi]|uniref:RRM domain-containing protein n=1 Tax=Phakopsora pachyrhizi TaxID=170000 RepID=A0AAV0AM03_PHAPC|nr:hypothetical protein BY996DRAFT_6408893 [Phakopsora pachyrhizi]CAH7669576.1 hypothetical protein PPACK8108_LOCUS4215 [Phakopsora pachyrhizi]
MTQQPPRSHPVKLSGDVNRILFVKNLNYKTKGEDLYDLFGKYGAIRQIRIGTDAKTRGTAFVVYEDILDAKNAFDHLNGFHLQERYLVVLYHQFQRQAAKADLAKREAELSALKKAYNISDEQPS